MVIRCKGKKRSKKSLIKRQGEHTASG